MSSVPSVLKSRGNHSGNQWWNGGVQSSTSNNGLTCVVCCHEIPGKHRRAIFAIGPCDHPICYHCAAKMRVLCEQNECPICRQEISEIIFTEDFRKKYNEYGDKRRFYFNDKFKIYFETQGCLDTFNSLLDERCKKCKTPLNSVHELQDHLWDKHRLLACDLCVQNLKIFSEERKYYTSGQLEAHMIHGDPDDRSYQGHPSCQLCSQRYVDSEELNRHLRREHYFCHLCDATKIIYYNKYETLNQHFAEEHYLCEEGPCKNEQFTSVFRTSIDLQAHKAQIHCLTKSEAKHARTLSLDLTFNPSTRGPRTGGFNPQVVASLNDDGFNSRSGGDRGRRGRGGGGGGGGDRGSDRNDRDRGSDRNPPTIPEDVWMTEDLDILGAVGPAQQILRLEDFPSLGEPSRQGPPIRPDGPTPLSKAPKVNTTNKNGTTTNGSNSNNPNSQAPNKPKHKFSTKVKESATFGRKDDEDFPALCVPDLKSDKPSTYRPVQPTNSTIATISLADAVKLNPKPPPPEKTSSQPSNGKTVKSTINSSNRVVNDLTDEPSSSQDFALAQNDFPSLPFKVNGNRKKKKALNILLASLNNPQPDPPPNYTSVRLVDSLIPKENNGSTSNRSDNDNGPSLEEDMESLLLKEDNFPPLAGEPTKSKSTKVNKKSTIESTTKVSTGLSKPSAGSSKSSGSSKLSGSSKSTPSFSSLVRPPPGYEKRANKKSNELSMKDVAEQVIKPKISTTTNNTPTTTNDTTSNSTTKSNHVNSKKSEINKSDNQNDSNNSNVSNSRINDKSGNKPTLPTNQRKLKRENFDQPTSNDRTNSKSAKQSASSKSTSTVNSILSSSSPQQQQKQQQSPSNEKVPTTSKHQNGTTSSRSTHNHQNHHHNEELPEYSYIYPKDFDERNRRLFDMIQSTLKDRFKDFDSISRAFFNDDIPPFQYYNKCVEMFRNKLNNILLDLIVLLPDIRKQKHLMTAHETNLKQRTGTAPKRTGIWEIKTDSELDVVVCPMCGQVLCKKDGPDHITTHQKIKS